MFFKKKRQLNNRYYFFISDKALVCLSGCPLLILAICPANDAPNAIEAMDAGQLLSLIAIRLGSCPVVFFLFNTFNHCQ